MQNACRKEGFKEGQQAVWRGAGRDGLCLQVREGQGGLADPDSAILGSHGAFWQGGPSSRSFLLPLTAVSLPVLPEGPPVFQA